MSKEDFWRIYKQIAENVICFFNGRMEVNDYEKKSDLLFY